MATFRPKVLIACDERVRNSYLPPEEIERLETFADWGLVLLRGWKYLHNERKSRSQQQNSASMSVRLTV